MFHSLINVFSEGHARGTYLQKREKATHENAPEITRRHKQKGPPTHTRTHTHTHTHASEHRDEMDARQ